MFNFRVGRKWTQGGFLILAGICCVLWALGHWAGIVHIHLTMTNNERERLPTTDLGCGEPLTLTLALAGKCAVANSFCALYLFSAELFPTEVRYTIMLWLVLYRHCMAILLYRSLGMGVVSVASRLGGIMSPIILIMVSNGLLSLVSKLCFKGNDGVSV